MTQRTLSGRTKPRPRPARGARTHRSAGYGRIGAMAWAFVALGFSFALAAATRLGLTP